MTLNLPDVLVTKVQKLHTLRLQDSVVDNQCKARLYNRLHGIGHQNDDEIPIDSYSEFWKG